MSDNKTINKTSERPGGGVSGILVLLIALVLIVAGGFQVRFIDENALRGLLGIAAVRRISSPRVGEKASTVLVTVLRRAGLRPVHLQSASMGTVALCISLWIRAKTVDQDERGNAERRALFVGLWPPTLWLIGDSLRRGRRGR